MESVRVIFSKRDDSSFKMEVALFINSHCWFNISSSTNREANNFYNSQSDANKTRIPWQRSHDDTYYKQKYANTP